MAHKTSLSLGRRRRKENSRPGALTLHRTAWRRLSEGSGGGIIIIGRDSTLDEGVT